MLTPKYYWDSSCFIALLLGAADTRTNAELAGLREVAALADAGEAYIITSGLTTAEVLNRQDDQTIRDRFRLIFERKHYRQIESNQTIYEKAADLRTQYKANKLKAPDATHLATAVLYHVDEMHTFDEDHLIALSGHQGIGGLKICKPSAIQKSFGI